MKKNLFYLLSLTIAVAALAGCNKSENPAELPVAAGEITMTAQDDGKVLLSIGAITNAETYHWYLGNDIVQNTGATTYLATITGVYKVAGVNVDEKEGPASPAVNVVAGLPGAAGEITQEIQADGFVLLSVNEIPRATTYRWYKGDQEVQNTNSHTFLATEDGSYKVAGVNAEGEGRHSEPSLVGLDIFNILTAEHIPNELFRNWIKDNLAGGSEVFTNYQAGNYDGEIAITNLQAGSLAGIEYFTSLRKLYCKFNLLASLDVSKNVNLTYLDCGNNALLELDISTLTKLDSLDVSQTSIKSLDFSGCKESLKFLKWNNNALTTAQFAALNIKALTNIKTINLASNNFADAPLDLSGMSTVESIDLTSCKLTGINLTGCSGMKKLIIGSNSTSLTSLDLTPCPVLEALYCQRNTQLATLTISHLTATLKEITFNNTKVADIDFTQFTKLEYVECQSTQLWDKTLDFSNCPNLKRLRCESSGIAGLNLTGCTKLEELYAYNNSALTGAISLANFKALTLAYLYSCQLTSVDVSGCTALSDLRVHTNQLTSLTLTGCSELDYLQAQNNKLTSVDVSSNTKLTTLNISYNTLGANLDISNNSLLTSFNCNGNTGLQKIKVWSAFDINSTPSGFSKPATAAWVYEF